MDRDSHIAGDEPPLGLVRITFILLSLLCMGGGLFVGLLGAWQGYLFSIFWLPLLFVGSAGRPKSLFEPVIIVGGLESSGFRSYARLDYLMMAAMGLMGATYILLTYFWPVLPHFSPGTALLYLFFATACNAYLWQDNFNMQQKCAGYFYAAFAGSMLLSARRVNLDPLAACLLYTSAWGLLHCLFEIPTFKAKT